MGEQMTGEARHSSGRSRPAKAPISSHAAFPAIVALWFAALLGLGSLILPVALFESVSRAANLGAILPAAAPPLGVSARIGIASLAAIVGGLLGLLIARRVARLQAADAPRERDPLAPLLRTGDSHPDAPLKRPIFAHAELGSQRLDDPLDADAEPADRPLGIRRRSLSLTGDSGRSEYLGSAPVSGETAAAQPHFSLHEETEEIIPDSETLAPDLPGNDFADQVEIAADRDDTLDLGAFAKPEEITFPDPEPAYEKGFSAQDQAQEAAASREDKPFEHMSLAELVDRFARSLQGRGRPEPAGDATLLRAALPDHQDFPADLSEPDGGPAGNFVDHRDGSDHETSPPNREPEASLQPPHAEHEEGTFRASKAEYIPAALRPLVFAEEAAEDEGADDDFRIDFSGSHRLFGPPEISGPETSGQETSGQETSGMQVPAALADPVAMAIAASDDEEDDSDDDFDGFSSLLAMKRPLETGRETVRIDDELAQGDGDFTEPVVTFPGQDPRPFARRLAQDPDAGGARASARPFDAPDNLHSLPGARPAPSTAPPPRRPDPAASEKALRDALEKLQRMSGAA
ncbi:hypothetical protein G7A66_12325 [Altererythrobacter sp. SALINAS58]|uniref:hypothetical protein n=1 Tax=Alteripontixanthobacter muriae TaxID=2705546 RepID=UPI0015771F94|nr:hypothetical protein [Alteripontixanthobacter muriae]NTZ43855.1 hypothetical protein [Alteripontixanthobacter muriae]